jgi:hypothetical protein
MLSGRNSNSHSIVEHCICVIEITDKLDNISTVSGFTFKEKYMVFHKSTNFLRRKINFFRTFLLDEVPNKVNR